MTLEIVEGANTADPHANDLLERFELQVPKELGQPVSGRNMRFDLCMEVTRYGHLTYTALFYVRTPE